MNYVSNVRHVGHKLKDMVRTLPEALVQNYVYLIVEWLCHSCSIITWLALHLGYYIPVNDMNYVLSVRHVGHKVMGSNPARGIDSHSHVSHHRMATI